MTNNKRDVRFTPRIFQLIKGYQYQAATSLAGQLPIRFLTKSQNFATVQVLK
jgi:hypothetical protein